MTEKIRVIETTITDLRDNLAEIVNAVFYRKYEVGIRRRGKPMVKLVLWEEDNVDK